MELQPGLPRNWWLVCLGLVILTWLLFLPVYDNRPVWDDWVNIVRNEEFRGLGYEQLRWSFSQVRLGHYQPLAWLTLSIDHALWGDNYGGYRLTNIAIHSANVVLFALIAFQILIVAKPEDRRTAGIGSLTAAAIFALHPMRVESVAWLTERRQLLGALFALATLYGWLRWVGGGEGRRLSWRAQVTLTVLFALSLLATPVAIALPLVLLVLDWYPLRRWPAVVEKLPLLLLSLIFVGTGLAAQQASQALIPTSRYGIWDRLIQAAYASIFYPRALLKTSWSPLYERPMRIEITEARFLISVLAFVGITVITILVRRRLPVLLAVWGCFLLLIAPVSGLAQSGVQLVADRYSYLAALGFALLIGWAGAESWKRCNKRSARLLWATALVSILGYWGWSTHRQIGIWRNDRLLWTHVADHGPSAMAHNNLGAEALHRREFEAALEHFRRAIEIAPTFGLPWTNLQRLLERDAVELDSTSLQPLVATLDRALDFQAHTATGWYIVGLAHLRAGETRAAISRLRQALEIKPDFAPARYRLGVALMEIGETEAATRELEEFLRLEPGNPKALRWLETAQPPIGDTQ